MAQKELHVGDSGFEFVATVADASGPIDLTQSTVKQFHFQKPDGTYATVDAGFAGVSGTGADGKIAFVVPDDFFDQAGFWRVQTYVEIGPIEWSSEIIKFRVYTNLPLEI